MSVEMHSLRSLDIFLQNFKTLDRSLYRRDGEKENSACVKFDIGLYVFLQMNSLCSRVWAFLMMTSQSSLWLLL